jgi:dipeptidyl aminopeptidase/acylaminoacyl peptidase
MNCIECNIVQVAGVRVFVLVGNSCQVSTLNAGLERQVRSQVTELLIDEPPNSPLHGYLLHAGNLDKPTPLLVDIHGGPDTAWRPSISPHYWYREVLLRRGWKVLLLNPRGSDGYGEQYMQAAVGNLGFSEEADFLRATEYLIAAGQVDRTRMAVMGASHGGFMTNWLTSRTDVFSAAVSISCIANWLSLYGTSDSAAAFIEFQMDGTPVDKPERYRDSSPLTYVHQVVTATLILHGENDHLNPIGQSEEWFTGLSRLTNLAEVEFARYPNSGHLLIYQSRPSVVLDAMHRIVDWLDKHAGVHSQRQAR